MASGGGSFSANGYSLSYTLGELSIKTLTKSSNVLTEGFQQGKPHKETFPYKEILYFPNPVVKDLTLVFFVDDGQSITVQVFSITGQMVGISFYDNIINGESQNIDFTRLAKGLYLVKVQSLDGKIQRTFKIERI